MAPQPYIYIYIAYIYIILPWCVCVCVCGGSRANIKSWFFFGCFCWTVQTPHQQTPPQRLLLWPHNVSKFKLSAQMVPAYRSWRHPTKRPPPPIIVQTSKLSLRPLRWRLTMSEKGEDQHPCFRKWHVDEKDATLLWSSMPCFYQDQDRPSRR